MAIETLANLEVYDSSAWHFANGVSKGLSVYDSSSWNIVKEAYVYDSGAWHYVHPIRAVSCYISTTYNGGCPSLNGYYRATMTAAGPSPQATAGTGSFYYWRYYRRVSTISSAHCQTLSWGFMGTTTGLTSGLSKTTYNISTGAPMVGSITNLWTQFQARLVHSVHPFTEAMGAYATSIVKGGKRELDCDGGPE